MADLLPQQQEEHAAPERPHWRPSRLDIAGIVAGLVVALAAIAALNNFAPAAPRLPSPTVAPAATSAPTATRAPTWTPTVAPTPTSEPPTATPEPPTPEVVYVPVAPPCDPQNPPYQVRMDVGDLGHVVGFSCNSIEEATERANQLAADMRATAEAR